ncbi:MAG: ABC transporter permease [Terriglobales bacterium]
MNLIEIIRQTISAMRAHKLRSFLTMFGIMWGIASVIILVGLGKGFNADQKKRLHTIGIDLVIVWAGRTSFSAGGYAAGREWHLNVNDAYLLKQQGYLFKTVSPELQNAVSEVSSFNAAQRPVRGVWPEYQNFRSLKVSQGRLMTEQDEAEGRRVVILGVESAQQLFPGQPAVGSTILMAGYPYTVIGVLQKKKQNGSYGNGPDNTQLFVPYASMARDFPPNKRPWHIPGYINNQVLEVGDPDQHEAAIAQLYRILGEAHHFDPKDEDALWVWNTVENAKMNERIFGVMTYFFGAVALMTLALGGIGVMNIMLVSVTERTREIGVRKALGATYVDIRSQFFAESAVITLISGIIGFAIAVGICWTMQNVTLPEYIPAPEISPLAIAASILTLGLITITAGMYPASRAAQLEPVECLRYE